jgi:predicted NBD/HSP70 family sugar kinase
MTYYAALDVSLRSVNVCVIDEQGEIRAETKLDSEVDDIVAYLNDLEAEIRQRRPGGWHTEPIPDLWPAVGGL